MTVNEHRPRLLIDITPQQYERLQRLMHHGMKKVIFGVLIDDLCDLLEENSEQREAILGAFMSRAVDIRVLKTIKAATHGNKNT